MRKLKASDIPVLCRSLKKLGFKDRFRDIAQDANSVKDAWGMGFELIWGLFDAATEDNGEAVIYDFLAGPFEMTQEEVRNLDLDVLFDSLKKLVEENNLTDFFRFAARSMK